MDKKISKKLKKRNSNKSIEETSNNFEDTNPDKSKKIISKKFRNITIVAVVILVLVATPFIFNSRKSDSRKALEAGVTNSGGEGLSISDPNVKIENGVQVVNMNQEGNGYNPNRFIIRKGVPVKWVINSISQNSCAVALVLSKFGINTILSPGENVIEFTPKETGEIRFSCSMGMYMGRFIVIDENADSAAKIIKESDESAKNSSGGGCCG